MTSSIAISTVDIYKKYKLYQRPSDRLKEALTPFRKPLYQEFLALDNVSMSVKKGETIGIIGRNGSGKSTLLQVLSGVTRPSSGQVTVNGRVSALLELGAGFNPEFTGKQNVYINAAILGLGKGEIDAVYQRIVGFANIGAFIDQPVKLYSSGMYVRLAFAVAISVNPEILIVDEALAVGDTLFQAKCFAKFREFQEKGITILFVTHALEMITSICSSALLLEKGAVLSKGDPKKVVDAYNRLLAIEPKQNPANGVCDNVGNINCLSHERQWQGKFDINPKQSRYGNGKAEIIEAGIFSSDGHPEQVLTKGGVYEFRMKIRFHEAIEKPIYAYTIKDIKGFSITGTNTMFQKVITEDGKPGDAFVASFRQKMVLNQGGYLLSFGCTGFEAGEFVVYERCYDYMAFEVVSERPGVGFVDMNPDVDVKKLAP